jgi:uncharacterized protein (DUF885 family)
MVVDSGIHFKNWTRDEAVAYTLSKQTSITQEDAESYVDRISVQPGQMTTYGVGERLLINLPKQAKTQLGNVFDIKAFMMYVCKMVLFPLILSRLKFLSI